MQHQADTSQEGQPCDRLWQSFVVTCQAAKARHPGKAAFDDPATRPIGRFVSVMLSVLSGGLTYWVVLSSAGDIRRQCRGADTCASAPAPQYRPTRSSGATPGSPSALAPDRPGSRRTGYCETSTTARPTPVPTTHPDRAPRGSDHAGAYCLVPGGGAASAHSPYSSAVRCAAVDSRRSRAGERSLAETSPPGSILGRAYREGRNHCGPYIGQWGV